MKRIFLVLNTVFLMTSLSAAAEGERAPDAGNTLAPANLESSLKSKANGSEKGVIMVLSGRGDVAAKAAFLLVSQLKENPGYAPMLLIAEQQKLRGYMKTLALTQNALPAVVFFDKSGKELNRVVAAQPVVGASGRILTAAIK